MHYKTIHLLASIFFVLVLSLTFYPKFYTSTDEREYIQNAYYILEGDLSLDNSECYKGAYCGYLGDEGWVSKYNLGLSFILLPFVALSWNFTFIVPVVFFILAIFIFHKILKHYKLPEYFIYLFALYPVFIYYSKKPLTEIPSMALILVLYYIIYIWNRNLALKAFLIGIIGGSLVLIRYTNAIVLIIFSISFLLHSMNFNTDLKVFIKRKVFLLSAIPFLLLFFYLNNKYYGGYITSGYSLSGEEFLVKENLILKQAIYYLGFLNLLYPGMLLVGLKSKVKGKSEIYLILLVYFLFYVGFPGYHFESGILDLIFGLRFFVPIIPLLLIGYFEAMSSFQNTNVLASLTKQFVRILILVLFINAIAMSYIYLERTKDLKEDSDLLYETYGDVGYFESENIEDRILINDSFGNGKVWFYYICRECD